MVGLSVGEGVGRGQGSPVLQGLWLLPGYLLVV